MASRKSTGSKMKSKGQKPSRASAMPPKPPAPLRSAGMQPPGAPTTMVPQPPLKDKGKAANPRKPATKTAEAGDSGSASLKKQELIALVVERSDVAKKHAKPVVEAMLAVLGDALADGRDLNLQPMGKIKRKRAKDTDKARIIVANIRQSKAAGAGASSKATQGSAPLPGSTPGGALIAPKEAVAEGGEGR